VAKGALAAVDSTAVAEFLNVDLDIWSTHNLQPLVNRLGKKVIVLYAGRARRKFSAHLELARHTTTADSTIRAFRKLIRALPSAERAVWDGASMRSFSIGIQAGTRPGCTDFRILPETIREVAELGDDLVLTIYSPALSDQPFTAAKPVKRRSSAGHETGK
jgi:hypothetical protein